MHTRIFAPKNPANRIPLRGKTFAEVRARVSLYVQKKTSNGKVRIRLSRRIAQYGCDCRRMYLCRYISVVVLYRLGDFELGNGPHVIHSAATSRAPKYAASNLADGGASVSMLRRCVTVALNMRSLYISHADSIAGNCRHKTKAKKKTT